MYIITFFLSVALHLLLFSFIALIVSLPLTGMAYTLSKRNRRRNSILVFASPFIFLFSFYFISLAGGYLCGASFGTGCGMDGYFKTTLPNDYILESLESDIDAADVRGNLRKYDIVVVEGISKIGINGDMVYGQKISPNLSDSDVSYFSLSLKTDHLDLFPTYEEAILAQPGIATELCDTEKFYYKRWEWVVPLLGAAFLISSGVLAAVWVVATGFCKSKIASTT